MKPQHFYLLSSLGWITVGTLHDYNNHPGFAAICYALAVVLAAVGAILGWQERKPMSVPIQEWTLHVPTSDGKKVQIAAGSGGEVQMGDEEAA